MSWKTAFTYAKSVAANHGIDSAKKEARADDNLPLGGRVGGMLSLQMSPFISASVNGSLITEPKSSDELIVSISSVKLAMSGSLHRYYLCRGDSETEQERFLQIFTTASRDTAEVLYCTRIVRFSPETQEDQDAFTGASGAGLGELYYSLFKEQLNSVVANSTLEGAFGIAERLDYFRDVGDSSISYVAPLQGVETRIDDKTGEHGLTQDVYFMPYTRDLADGSKEYLIVSTEIVNSQDGDESRRSIYVDLMIGIPMDIQRITVQ